MGPHRVLVIGAGLTGAIAAATLARAGCQVSVVDKARGPGGRMASRRSEEGRFDHGAQSFTVRAPSFIREVQRWERDGWVAPWTGRLACWDGQWSVDSLRGPRWVATPRMSALPRAVLEGVPARFGTRVSDLRNTSAGVSVHAGEEPLGVYEWVVVTAPAPQSASLCRSVAPTLASKLDSVSYWPCWAAMVTGEMSLPWDGARVTHGPLSWVARQDTLPGRAGQERWVLHGSPSWSKAQLECDVAVVEQHMGAAFEDMCGRPVRSVRAHRWRFARVKTRLSEEILCAGHVIVAGDACSGSRVEGSWHAGKAAANRILDG
jgi:renalase